MSDASDLDFIVYARTAPTGALSVIGPACGCVFAYG